MPEQPTKLQDENGVRVTLEYIQRDVAETKENVKTLRALFTSFETERLSKVEIAIVKLASEVEPIKRVVYGLVAMILTGVIGAVLYMVIE